MYTIVSVILLVLLVFLISIVLIVYFALIHTPYRLHRFYSTRTWLPVAPFLTFGGYLHQLRAYKAAHNTLGWWRHSYDTYGPLHAINYGKVLAVKLDDPHYLAGVLRSHSAHYRKSEMTRVYMTPTTGLSNLLLLEGDGHARHRRMMNPG